MLIFWFYSKYSTFLQNILYQFHSNKYQIVVNTVRHPSRMSSNDYERSSSSPVSDNQNGRHQDKGKNRSRSRSRDNKHRRPDREQYQGNKRQRVVRIPELLGQLVNFRTFLSYQPDKISKQIAEKQYQVYKAQWEQKSNKVFFIQHKNDAWFQERYNPEVLDAIQKQRKDRVVKLASQFVNQFKDGFYDDIDLAVKQYNQLGFLCNERDQQFEELKDANTSNSGIPINFQTVDINMSAKINLSRAPFFGFDPDANTMFIKAIPRTISKFDIFQVVGKLEGFQNITLSQPIKKLHFSRYCWISFINEECLKKAQTVMNGLTIKNQPIAIGSSSSRSRKVKILNKYPSSRISTDADVVKRLAAKLDEQCGVMDNILLQTQFTSAKKQLDIFIVYLRRVHAHDYYTSTSYSNERTLCLRLGRAFLRIQADYEQVPGFQTIFKKMQNAAENRINNGSPAQQYMNRVKQDIEKTVIKLISQTEQNPNISAESLKQRSVWECVYCKKKFKTCEFEAKHIIIKHPEVKDRHIQSIMEEAYNEDPHKITNYGNYGTNRDDRDSIRGRRPGGFRRGRGRQYRDLDDPEVNQNDRPATKSINFLDI